MGDGKTAFRTDAVARGYLDGIPAFLLSHDAVVAGNPLAEVACISTLRFPVSAPVADALRKSIPALGYADEPCVYVNASAPYGEFALCLEMADPLAIIALDSGCSEFLARFLGDPEAVASGYGFVNGRRFAILDDFEGALDDDDRKRSAWGMMRHVARR